MAADDRRWVKGQRLMTVVEVARHLRVHPTTIYRLCKTGKMPGFKIGDSWRFDPERIEQWLREAESGSGQK